jgi:PKD repeat protein
MKRILLSTLLIFTLAIFGNVQAQQQAGDESVVVKPTMVSQAIYHDVFGPLSDLPALTPEEVKALEEKYADRERNEELKERLYPFFDSEPKGPDPGWQKQMGQNSGSKVTLQNFAGQSSYSNPPDCNGTVGPNHYMQTINVTYTIYNKTGTLLAGPTNMNTLFSGVPGAGNNDGDPIIMYDEQADRWLAAEFSGIYNDPDYMLIAVSTTNDPTGTWNRWSFVMNGFPDYMKFGIWRDGYYMGANSSGAGNDDIYVFERSVMIAGGASPKVVQFDNANRPNSGFHCVLPMDNDGVFAPSGTPGQFVTINDGAWGGSDQLWIYELSVNWTTPSSSTFSRVQTLNVASFDSNFGSSWQNIPQQGTSQKLDAIPQVLMNRAQYRNWGTSQSLVCCHTVDVDGTDHAGIRWYELQNTGSGWSIRQYGTYAPDAHSRWMASIAMNNQHEIGLGYSVSSSSMHPAIRYCGQSASANASATGNLDMAETSIIAGTASQTSSERWGDYANIALDPNNDNDFWFTTEYNISTSQKGTRIASFKFAAPPVADFIANNTHPANSLTTVIFTDQSTNSPTTWNWTFTPNTVTYVSGNSTSQNPQVRFNNPGAYTVSLYVTNAYGNDTETKTDYIHVGQPGLWGGNTSTDWNTNTNWDNGEVPFSTTDVSITAAPHNFWPTKTGNLVIGTDCNSLNMGAGYTELVVNGNLTISNGKTFYVDPTGNAAIKVGGNWTATGTFTEGLSTVSFFGNTTSTLGSAKKSGKALVTSLFENFDGGSLPTGWSINNSSATVGWNVDASPNPPGFYSSAYSLNYNDGTDYDDGNGNNGTVTTAAIDNSNANSTTISFYYQLSTEGAVDWDWVEIEVLRASDNAVLQTIGGDGTSIADVGSWTQYTINGNAAVVAESSIKLRFTFSADDNYDNAHFGWFIDDLKVERDVTITSISFFNLTDEKFSSGLVTTNSDININNDFILRAGSYFTNNSGYTLTVLGNSYFEANAGGMASFIDNGVSNFVNFQPDIQVYLVDGKWHFIGMPVNSAMAGVFHLPSGHSDIYLRAHNEATNTWGNYIVPVGAPLVLGQGYETWVGDPLGFSQPETLTFKGIPNSGNYTTGSGNFDTLLYTSGHGLNLISNPYPSALQGNINTWTKTNVDNSIWTWSSSDGNYVYWNGTNGTGGGTGVGTMTGGVIPAMQGFFVLANNSSPLLTIPQSDRIHDNQAYYKESEIPANTLMLEVDANDYKDIIFVMFNEQATEAYDNDFDVKKLYGLPEAPQLYSMITGEQLSINSLPELTEYRTVQLGFECGLSGTYTITASEIESFNGSVSVYLEDTKEGTIQNLSSVASHTFEYDPFDELTRFVLHFGEPNGVGELNGDNVKVYANDNVVYIQKPAGLNGNIIVYDMLGQEIASKKTSEEELIRIPVTNGTGYYVVKVQLNDNMITRKVFIR